MRIKKKYLMALTVVSLLLSGCGTQLFELTAEEEELIIQSAAYFVAKHNIQQKDGVSNIILEEESESKSDTESETQQPEEENTEQENSTGGISSENQTAAGAEISLVEAIGHAGELQISYEGSFLADDYMDGGYITAPEGYTYFIMKFRISNVSANDVALNNFALHPSFRITGQSVNVSSEATVLLSDFSTYIGTVSAGQSVETILFFPVETLKAESISAPTLYITIQNESRKVKL